MKIKSTTDIITNSSSEIFTLRAPGKTKEEVKRVIEEFHNSRPSESCTGMGGLIEVLDFNDRVEIFRSGYPKSKQSLVTGEDYLKTSIYPEEIEKEALKVNIDDGFTETIKWVPENFEILDADGDLHPVYDKKGEKIIEFTDDWEKWDNLPRLESLGKYWCDNYEDQE